MSVLAIDEGTFVGELSEADIQARVRVLRVIASQYLALIDPMQGPGGVKGDGNSLALMPQTYSATVREFERLLGVMREDRAMSLELVDGVKVSVRRLRWHVNAFYVEAQAVTRHFPLPLKKGSRLALMRDQDGQAVTTRPVTRVHRHPGASVRLADAGLAWIAAEWSLNHEPFLPDALRDS